MDEVNAKTILTAGLGNWSATPWDYSSLRWLHFNEGGFSKLTYGYGQTIYAVIRCHWEVTESGRLKLTYYRSPAEQRFPGFKPEPENKTKELEFRLQEGEVSGTQSIVPAMFSFRWKLELSESPWPNGLQLPYEIPREFYGHPLEENTNT